MGRFWRSPRIITCSVRERPRTRHAIATLADQPHPDGAVARGATGIYRLHAGEVRVLYEVDDAASTVYIINIGLT
jgi:mRNA-degrading endonuclease RelE of RelBE toxin-antitoxin system